jgi:hypothetical protein
MRVGVPELHTLCREKKKSFQSSRHLSRAFTIQLLHLYNARCIIVRVSKVVAHHNKDIFRRVYEVLRTTSEPQQFGKIRVLKVDYFLQIK